MMEPKIWVFFYGSYMNLGVLRDVDLVPEGWEVGRLSGFDIRIQPRANLIRSDRDCVYGIAATATHAELARLYAHARDVLGRCTSRKPCWWNCRRACGGRASAISARTWRHARPTPPMSGASSQRRENPVSRPGTSSGWRVFSPEHRPTKQTAGRVDRVFLRHHP
jgi:hypothetical protein